MTKDVPLILLPAFMTTRALWGAQIANLSDIASIDVVELSPYDSIDSMAEAVLERAPDRFALAGLSLGGFTAFEIVRRRPIAFRVSRSSAPVRASTRRSAWKHARHRSRPCGPASSTRWLRG